jgi:hypothetical protein
MTTLVRAELLKLRTTRALPVTLALLLAFTVVGICVVALADDGSALPTDGSPLTHLVRLPAQITAAASLVLGVLLVGGEHRHRTRVLSALAEPRRGRALVAQLLAVSTTAAAVSLVVSAVAATAGLVVLRSQDVPAEPSGDAALVVLAAATGCALLAVVGGALAGLFGGTTGAIGLAFGWAFVIEGVVPVVLRRPELADRLPWGALSGLLAAGTGAERPAGAVGGGAAARRGRRGARRRGRRRRLATGAVTSEHLQRTAPSPAREAGPSHVRPSLGAVTELPLGLKAQRPKAPHPARKKPATAPADEQPVARVVVDTGLAHLDRPFDYLVPAAAADAAHPGVRVRVRFAGRLVDGWVLSREDASEHPGRLAPLSVVSPERVLTPEVAELARAVADRCAGTLPDVLRLAIPPRHARVEAEAPAGRRACPPLRARRWSRYRAGAAFLDALAAGARRGRSGPRCPARPGRPRWRGWRAGLRGREGRPDRGAGRARPRPRDRGAGRGGRAAVR